MTLVKSHSLKISSSTHATHATRATHATKSEYQVTSTGWSFFPTNAFPVFFRVREVCPRKIWLHLDTHIIFSWPGQRLSDGSWAKWKSDNCTFFIHLCANRVGLITWRQVNGISCGWVVTEEGVCFWHFPHFWWAALSHNITVDFISKIQPTPKFNPSTMGKMKCGVKSSQLLQVISPLTQKF